MVACAAAGVAVATALATTRAAPRTFARFIVSPDEEVVTRGNKKAPRITSSGPGNCHSILHPKRPDILRERVVIRGAIAVRVAQGGHESNVPAGTDRQGVPPRRGS